MRIVLFLLLLALPGQALAFGEDNCPVFAKAFRLPSEAKASPAARRVLLALTVLPPSGSYLYGPESREGLPTELALSAVSVATYPMTRPAGEELDALMEKRGRALAPRAPAPSLKKDTAFAAMTPPGSADGNPLIYPGPVTFWAELLVEAEPLGGVLVRARLSGLLCSPTSCMPAAGSLDLGFSMAEIAALPLAEEQSWWAAWNAGKSVLIDPPEEALRAALLEKKPSPFGPPPVPARQGEGTKDTAAELARYSGLFSTLTPTPFNPSLEVQYLGEALLLGLAAGLLLNLMPCVLPVISLKFSALMAVSAMTDKREQARAFKRHCLIFALGIVVWFLALAMLLGWAGWAWGELFQEPVVIVCLGMILFLLALSLFGVFSLPLVDLKVASESHPHWQAFASGLLATLLATPCSGPLLGGVLAWAIRQPLPILTLTVVSVGVGMAMPYLVLAFFPHLVRLLPRPGAWTVRLEQLLGFLLMGSVVYAATLLPVEWLPAFLVNLLAVAMAAWLWGQIGHLRASRLRRAVSRGLAVTLIVLAAWWGSASLQDDATWEAFSPEALAASLGKEPLLLEFTADWCPSCKALEHTTLTKKRMADLRKKYNVRTIRVDLTRDAQVETELLKALDSTSIPVVALFPKGENAKQPLVLRDLVTPKQLLEAAERAF